MAWLAYYCSIFSLLLASALPKLETQERRGCKRMGLDYSIYRLCHGNQLWTMAQSRSFDFWLLSWAILQFTFSRNVLEVQKEPCIDYLKN